MNIKQKSTRFLITLRIEFLLFLRDFFGAFFTFLFPVMMLLLFGSIYGNEPAAMFGGIGPIDASVPAYSVMIMGVTGLMAFPLTLAGCKEKNIYKRMDATPAGKGFLISVQIMVQFLMTLCGFVILLVSGRLLYGLRIQGSLLPIAGALLLSIAAMFSIGFLFTAIAPNERICNLLCYICYFIMIFLSGATMPMQIMPENIKRISAFLPMTYAVQLLQGTFRGTGAGLGRPVVILSMITILCTSTGALLYRKKSWS